MDLINEFINNGDSLVLSNLEKNISRLFLDRKSYFEKNRTNQMKIYQKRAVQQDSSNSLL